MADSKAPLLMPAASIQAGAASLPPSLTFIDIGYSVPAAAATGESKVILESISGHVPAGTLLAVMGATGAGKTTLLDVLAGRTKTGVVSGQLLIDGHAIDIAPNASAGGAGAGGMASRCGYVMQDDALLPHLSVRETLEYSVRLRGGAAIAGSAAQSAEEIKRRRTEIVNSILSVLNLTRVADTRIGTQLERGISGGERRRVSIGVELVTSPKLLFIDEPTSGLDSRNALRVMRALIKLCRAGHTVITTIHQPRSNVFFMFDRLLLLGEGGRTVYFGAVREQLLPYLQSVGAECPNYLNPADHILDVLDDGDADTDADDARDDADTVDAPTSKPKANGAENGMRSVNVLPVAVAPIVPSKSKQLIDAWRQSPAKQSLDLTITQVRSSPLMSSTNIAPSVYSSASVCEQTLILTQRTWQSTIRDSNVVYVRTGAAGAIGFLVGGIFYGQPDTYASADSRIHVLLFLMCVFSLFCLPAISKCIEERLLYTRERASGFYGPLAYTLSISFVELPLLFAVIVLYGSLSYWLVGLQAGAERFLFFLVTIYWVICVGFSVAQCISAAVRTVSMAIACYMIILVYSLLLGGFIVPKTSIPHAIQWALRTSYFNYGFEALCVNEFEAKSWGEQTLTDLGFEGGNKNADVAVLVSIFVALRTATYLLLRFVNKEKR